METLLAACAFPRIDFLKLDVEGAEHEVLAGNPAWLTRVKVPCSAAATGVSGGYDTEAPLPAPSPRR